MPAWTRRGFLGAVVGSGAVPGAVRAAVTTGEPAADAVVVEVNGAQHRLTVDDDERAIDVVRDRLGLTAAKDGCGEGACGACTVHLDGAPVASCLLPATALHGRRLTTAESVEHALQRAFAAEDALACGFCTPGMLMAAIPFVDAWRQAHPGEAPTREEIAAALAGNLCRCGAYDGIFRAVAATCAGRHDAPGPIVGPRPEAEAKIRGRAAFTTDLTRPGMLHGSVRRATVARGVVRTIDLGPAQAVAGVGAVIALVGVGDVIRHAGQPLVAVAGVSLAAARRAAAAVRLEIGEETPAIGLDAARVAAPVWGKARADVPVVTNRTPAPWHGNLRGPIAESVGLDDASVERGVAAAELRLTTTVETMAQAYATPEPPACVAEWQGDTLSVWTNTSAVSALAGAIARRWSLRADAVRVRAEFVGGAMGDRTEIDPVVALCIDLARAAGAPVRLVLELGEALLVGGHAPHHRITLGVGATGLGFLKGVSATTWSDAGVAVGDDLATPLRLAYPTAAKRVAAYDVLTNDAPARSVRAPGGAAVHFALETAVDGIARKMGADPIVLRRRLWEDPTRDRLLDAAARSDAWARHGHAAAGRLRRGVGLACGSWSPSALVGAQVRVRADADGFSVLCATQDPGNGARAVLAGAVAGVLGVPAATVRVQLGDSELPRGPASALGRTTSSLWAPAQAAATELGQLLAERLAAARGMGEAFAVAGGVSIAGVVIPWAELLAGEGPMEAVGRRHADMIGPLGAPDMDGGRATRDLCHAVQITEVEVDRWLGRVRVVSVWARYAIGPIAVPALAERVAMGVVQEGLSHALFEERRLDTTTGRLRTASLHDYRIAGPGDAPRFDLSFDEAPLAHHEGGRAGLTALAACPVLGSVANAIADATGVYPSTLPARMDRLLAEWG